MPIPTFNIQKEKVKKVAFFSCGILAAGCLYRLGILEQLDAIRPIALETTSKIIQLSMNLLSPKLPNDVSDNMQAELEGVYDLLIGKQETLDKSKKILIGLKDKLHKLRQHPLTETKEVISETKNSVIQVKDAINSKKGIIQILADNAKEDTIDTGKELISNLKNKIDKIRTTTPETKLKT